MEASQETIIEFNNNNNYNNNDNKNHSNEEKKLFKKSDLFKAKLIHIDDFPSPCFVFLQILPRV